LLKWNK